jgi:hypothetical protein
MKSKVVKVNKEPYDVFIGRPSKWGNPFSIGMDGNRQEVLEMYERWLNGEIEAPKHHHWYVPPTKEEILTLKGKILGCFCKPKACHGDILLKIIEKSEMEDFMADK